MNKITLDDKCQFISEQLYPGDVISSICAKDRVAYSLDSENEYCRLLQEKYLELKAETKKFLWFAITVPSVTFAIGLSLAYHSSVPQPLPERPQIKYIVEQRCGNSIPERIISVNGIEQVLEVDGKPVSEYGIHFQASYCTK